MVGWYASEPRLADWTINLYLDDGDGIFNETTPTATQITSPDGTYSFTGLVAGDYWVREVPQAGWSQTTADPSLITIASGDNFTQADYPGLAFGNSEVGSPHTVGYTDVFGSITTVANRRAQQVTMSEAGTLTSISIYHDGGTGNVLLGVYDDSSSPGSQLGVTALTGINATAGWQMVDLLSPVVVVAGQTIWLAWIFESNPGIHYTTGSPGRADSGQTWTGDPLVDMPLAFGGSTQAAYIYSIYATYTPTEVVTGEIHGFKWHDLDGNGLWGDEPGLAGWTIYLDLNDNGVLDAGDVSTVTGVDGSYSFTDLTAGTYTVAEELRDDWSQTYPVAAGTHTVAVSSGEVVTDINFGNQGPVVGLPEVYGSVVTSPNRRAMSFVMPESGSLESISIYHDGGSGNVLLGVYDDSSSPGSQLGVTALTAINSTAGWQTVDLVSAVDVVAGQTIWLAWIFESNPGIHYTTGSPGRADSGQTWTGDPLVDMPLTFGSSTQAAYLYSIYATYTPDMVTQTIGYTDVFGSTTTTGNRRAQQVTMAEDGTITSVSIYHGGGTGNVLLAVYADSSGLPGSRLAVTASTSINAGAGWQTVDLLSSIDVSAGTVIWLAWVFESNPGIRYEVGTPGRADSGQLWSGDPSVDMPSTFGGATQLNYIYSIYAIYSPGAVAAATLNVLVEGMAASIPAVPINDTSISTCADDVDLSTEYDASAEVMSHPANYVAGSRYFGSWLIALQIAVSHGVQNSSVMDVFKTSYFERRKICFRSSLCFPSAEVTQDEDMWFPRGQEI
jgi:hypothetical protein